MIKKSIKKDFPVLGREVNSKSLVYLDNAATSQSPRQVMDAWVDYYSKHRSNVHRGVHTLSEESTDIYENARKNVAKYLGARDFEIIFVRNTTEAVNLVSFSYLESFLNKGDTIVISEAEHHSNMVPWQVAAKKLKLNLEPIPLKKDGKVDLGVLEKLDYEFLAINHVSNFLGNVNPIKKIVNISKEKGAKVFVDGAQGVPHLKVNMNSLGCDFYAFSGHKIYAPFGIGVLYVKSDVLDKVEAPFLTGGGMIKEVKVDSSSYLNGVERFDAGTPNVGGAVALTTALNYVDSVGIDNIEKHEKRVLEYMLNKLLEDDSIEIYGPKSIEERVGLVSFNLKDIHSHDVASILDSEGVAVRSGHHCTMPAHEKLEIPSSVRASIALYNFKEDVDRLMVGLDKAKKLLGN